MIKTSSAYSSSEQHNAPAYSDIPSTVTCSICGAMYTPSHLHQDLRHAPAHMLDATFMSMCHFCFRCRRPACPQCWDPIHGVCGECVQEAHLPFRQEVAPLDGLVFPLPLRQSRSVQENAGPVPLVCIRPGRFQSSSEAQTLVSLPSVQVQVDKPVSSEADQIAAAETVHQRVVLPQQSPTPITKATPLPEDGKQHEAQKTHKRGRRKMKVVKRLLFIFLLIVVLSLTALIVLAEVSASANAYITSFLHIDIRGEIAYLVQLVQQLF